VPRYVYYLAPDGMSVRCRPFDVDFDLWNETINLRRDAQWESQRGNLFGTADEANRDKGPRQQLTLRVGR
jgi:hypothetical protein